MSTTRTQVVKFIRQGKPGEAAVNIAVEPSTVIFTATAQYVDVHVRVTKGAERVKYGSGDDNFSCSGLSSSIIICDGNVLWNILSDGEYSCFYRLLLYKQQKFSTDVPFKVYYNGQEYDKNIRVSAVFDGTQGKRGPTLRGPQSWSDCANGYGFQAGGEDEEWKDVVMYKNNYYSCVKSHVKASDNYPGSTNDQNNGYWQLGDKMEMVATKILLTAYALVENLGVSTVEMKDSTGKIIFEVKNGNVTCNTGTFTNINASGTFQSKNEMTWNQIIIDALSGYFVMRGPDSVDDDDRDFPSSTAKLRDLFLLEFQTDPDTLSRIASMSLLGGARSIQIDPIYGVVIKNGSNQISISDFGIIFQGSNQYLSKSWYDLLR